MECTSKSLNPSFYKDFLRNIVYGQDKSINILKQQSNQDKSINIPKQQSNLSLEKFLWVFLLFFFYF